MKAETTRYDALTSTPEHWSTRTYLELQILAFRVYIIVRLVRPQIL